MAIRVKPGVVLSVILTPMLAVLVAADKVYGKRGLDAIITSTNEGKHKKNSFHYKDLAYDFRTHHVSTSQERQKILQELRNELGADYDCILENLNTPNEHIHIEQDIKQ